MRTSVLPIAVVLLAVLILWYAASIWLNAPLQFDLYRGQVPGPLQFVLDTWSQKRPVLSSPHQVAADLWATTVQVAPTSKRSLLYHAWDTVSTSLLGFGF